MTTAGKRKKKRSSTGFHSLVVAIAVALLAGFSLTVLIEGFGIVLPPRRQQQQQERQRIQRGGLLVLRTDTGPALRAKTRRLRNGPVYFKVESDDDEAILGTDEEDDGYATEEEYTKETIRYMATYLANRLGRSYLRTQMKRLGQRNQKEAAAALTQGIPHEELEQVQKTIGLVQEKVETAWTEAGRAGQHKLSEKEPSLQQSDFIETELVKREGKKNTKEKLLAEGRQRALLAARLHLEKKRQEKVDLERPLKLHQKEGDRVVALKDEFSDEVVEEASAPVVVVAAAAAAAPDPRPPSVMSTVFGRALEVIQDGIPPLREFQQRRNEEKDAHAGTVRDMSSTAVGSGSYPLPPPLLAAQQTGMLEAEQETSSESSVVQASAVRDLSLDSAKGDDAVSVKDAKGATDDPVEEMYTSGGEKKAEAQLRELRTALAEADSTAADPATIDEVSAKDQEETKATSDRRSASIAWARQQPKPFQEEKKLSERYSRMSLAERAFAILYDLGMIEKTPNPADPDYDNSKDDELAPENAGPKQD